MTEHKRPTTGIRLREERVLGLNETARRLVHAMVWEGKTRRQAILDLDCSPTYGYRLLRSPEVLGHLRLEMQALRTSSMARAIHRLEEIAEQSDNLTAAVAAAKQLLAERDGNRQTVVNVQVSPGYVIDVSAALAAHPSEKMDEFK
jgi:hypothetical protein